MGRRRLILAGATAALLIAIPVGWYFGSPWWTLWRMREAARAGDAAALAAYVDWDEISSRHRRDYRMWMRSVLDTVRPDDPRENVRDFRAYAARELARPDGEIAVPAEDIRLWLAQIPVRFAGFGAVARPHGFRPYLVRYGLDRFEVRDEQADWELGPVLAFEREGLGWRLVGVRWGQQ